MSNYPQLDDCQGVWKMKEVSDANKSGLWRNVGTRMLFAGGSYWIGLQNEGMWASNRKYRPNNTLWECFNC